MRDYKGWGDGVKKGGYGSEGGYGYGLIDMIELYELDKYDRKDGIKWMKELGKGDEGYLGNDLVYIVVGGGDRFKKVCKEFDMSEGKLRK